MGENSTTPGGFIPDGYTIPFEIREVPGVSIGISGTRRPFTHKDLMRFLESVKPSNYTVPAKLQSDKLAAAQWIEDQIDAARSNGIAKQIVTWDLCDPNGSPVAVNAENVSRVYPGSLLGALMSTVCGTYKPDGKLDTSEDADDEKN